MRAMLWLLFAGAIPFSPGFAEDIPKRDFLQGRRISSYEHGSLSSKLGEPSELPIFDDGGRDWTLELKRDRYLIRRALTTPEEKRLYLGFQMKPSVADKQVQVILKNEPDESCHWLVEDAEKKEPLNPNSSRQFVFLKAGAGEFRGWYLTPGEPIKVKNDIVVERSASLSKEKTAKARLKVWQDGK